MTNEEIKSFADALLKCQTEDYEVSGVFQFAQAIAARERERCKTIANRQAQYYHSTASEACELRMTDRAERFSAMKDAAYYIFDRIEGSEQ